MRSMAKELLTHESMSGTVRDRESKVVSSFILKSTKTFFMKGWDIFNLCSPLANLFLITWFVGNY